jgi:Putative abortive phage resistance protein AbiGi, antitoxin
MDEQIEDLLHRRTDLSTFLVHFTRASGDGMTGQDNLFSILKSGKLEARSAYGMAAQQLAGRFPAAAATQRGVCFTETPLEHAWMMCRPIAGRRIRFDGYGLAVTKTFARSRSVNPVWYLDISQRGPEWLTEPVNRLVSAAIASAADEDTGGVNDGALAEEDILRLTPFIEQMGPTRDGGRKEFWWEREWRHVGNLSFEPDHVVVAFAPEGQQASLRARLAEATADWYEDLTFVDVNWGIERIIGALANVRPADLGPFPR